MAAQQRQKLEVGGNSLAHSSYYVHPFRFALSLSSSLLQTMSDDADYEEKAG
jgi:hypothetical protein